MQFMSQGQIICLSQPAFQSRGSITKDAGHIGDPQSLVENTNEKYGAYSTSLMITNGYKQQKTQQAQQITSSIHQQHIMTVQFSHLISTVNDFPKPGIVFRDVSPLLRNAEKLNEAIELMVAPFTHNKDRDAAMMVNVVAGIDARGFAFGTLVAKRLGVGFVMLRKPSKMPNTVKYNYSTEYAKSNTLEIQKDAIAHGERVLIVDDLLATGGTAAAACKLIETVGGVVAGVCCLIELVGLDGRNRLEKREGRAVHCVLHYPAHMQKPISKHEGVDLVATEYEPLEMRRNPEDERVIILAYPPMRKMAEQIRLLYPTQYRIGHVRWGHFPDGWPNVQFDHMDVLEGKHVMFLGSLYEQSSLTEQLSLLMVLPRQHVQSLNIVLPYFAPATMERVEQEGILATAETVARIISSSMPPTRNGPPVMRIFDLHALPVRFYFNDQVNMRLMTAIPLLLDKLRGKRVTIAFPDEGALKRFKHDFKGYPTVVCSKVRDGNRRVVRIVDHINWPTDAVEQKHAMRHIVIVDDLVQTGGTLHECRLALQTEGFERISAYVTHAVFPNEGHLRFAKGGDREGFHRFYTTDTVPETASKLGNLEPFCVLGIGSNVATEVLTSLGIRPIMQSSPYMPIYVYVASSSDSKLRGVKDAFEDYYNNDVVRIFSVPVPSRVSAQPIGERETESGCRNRLVGLLHYISENKLHSLEARVRIYAISIENGFMKDDDGVWSDRAIVQIARVTDSSGRCERKGDAYEFETEIFETERVACPENISVEEVIKMGADVTVGSVIESRLGLLQDTWHMFVCGTSRAEIIQRALTSYIKCEIASRTEHITI